MRSFSNIVMIILLGAIVAACGGGEGDPSQSDATNKIEPIGFEARIGIIPASAE